MHVNADRFETTIVSLFCSQIAARPEQRAIQFRRDGIWQTRCWRDLGDEVRRLAAVLVNLGVAPGDRVIQLSENRYEWIVADLAIQLARAVHVPVHASLAGPQVVYQIQDSGARAVLLSGPDQAVKLTSHLAAQDHPALSPQLKFISYDACPGAIGRYPLLQLDRLMGEADESAGKELEAAALAHVRPGDLATILYTSGTTGEPKGVMLSQRNLASNALGTLEAFGQQADDLRLSWLPLSHIFARTCDLYTWIASGSELALAENPEAVTAVCRELHPTLINGVPYFFEKVQRYLVDNGLADQPGVLAAAFGGRLRAACSGGAPLPDHVARFCNDRGVFLAQGYGLTESSPVITAGTPAAMKIGTAGRPIPGVEVKISADGEILTRGPHVMLGYWNKPQATAEALHDGWLSTGDMGEIDSDGFLKITGRKKEIIVTSAGKNIAPAHLEALLKADPLIEQAVVIGDARNYLSALIIPNCDALQAELQRREIHVNSAAETLTHPDVLALYQQHINERLSGVSYYEQIRKFKLLERPLSAERGEMTLTLKLRRQAIQANFKDAIEDMYK
jgi:long-chain acyl-CoA synthetase